MSNYHIVSPELGLYWSNQKGWVDKKDASVFCECEYQKLPLPIEGLWFLIEDSPAQLACERIAAMPKHDKHYGESDDNACMVRDLLTDIRHFCEKHGVDFYMATHLSHQIYAEERATTS